MTFLKLCQNAVRRLLLVTIFVANLCLSTPYGGALYDANAVANPTFEYQLNSWQQYTRHAAPDSSITVDTSRAVSGSFSARIDMGSGVEIGFIGLYQVLPFPQGKLLFNNLTNIPDGFDFWFYIDPKYDGPADFMVRVLSPNAREMDYVFDPDPVLSYPNTTFPDGRVMTKIIPVHGYSSGQWHHFTRNIRADWQSPVKMPSGQFLPGYGLNESLNWIEFDAIGFRSYTGRTYSETVWVDNVVIHYDSNSPPLPLPPGDGQGPLPTNTGLFLLGVIIAAAVLLSLLARHKRKRTALERQERATPQNTLPDLPGQ